MHELRFEDDIRSTQPNATGHRKSRFREGWRKSSAGELFGEQALTKLAWENLGYRLGTLFLETSPELVDELYDWCVRQQLQRGQPAPNNEQAS